MENNIVEEMVAKDNSLKETTKCLGNIPEEVRLNHPLVHWLLKVHLRILQLERVEKLLRGKEVDAHVPSEWLSLPEMVQEILESNGLLKSFEDCWKERIFATIFAMLEDENALISIMLQSKCLPSNPKCAEIAAGLTKYRNQLQDAIDDQMRIAENDHDWSEISLAVSVFRSLIT